MKSGFFANPKPFLVAWMALFAATAVRADERWMLDWCEEFSRDGLVDGRTWDYEVGFKRNRERQYYVGGRKENCRVKDGKLILTARKEKWRNAWHFPGNGNWAHQSEFADFTSASIVSHRTFGYGRLEIRAKLPAKPGAWPALWLLGDTCRLERDDPGRQDWPACGEIDLAEIWGHRPERMQGALHSPEGDPTGCVELPAGKAYDDGYHVYALDWRPGRIDMYFDGEKYFSRETEYFSRPMYLIVNLALGGGKNEELVDAAAFPMEMKVDYIRHYVRVSGGGDIRLVAPADGASVPLLPDCQKAAAALGGGHTGRRTLPLVLKWKQDGMAKGPWRIRIATDAELTDGIDRYVLERKTEEGVCRCALDDLNLEIGRRYWWRVSSRGRCGKFGCGPRCGCAASQAVVASDVGSFVTDPSAPRWIGLEGRTGNVRDLGGRIGLDGRKVRQGLVFRGQGLNDSSANGERAGDCRLTGNDISYLRDGLGIRTDLDLRNDGEVADMARSPLGEGVRLVRHPSGRDGDIFTEEGKQTMARNFRLFCDRRNYPVYVHCDDGAERTGSLAYVLNGILGVSKRETEIDWEMSFCPELSEGRSDAVQGKRLRHFDEGFARYGGDDVLWTEKIVRYLWDCGVTESEIRAFRELMLGPK